MMDELAARAKADPVEYRLRHLRDPRLGGRASRRESRRTGRRVPRRTELGTGTEPEPELEPERRHGRGIACVLYEGDNGYCAMVAEVDVNLDTGVVDVKRLVMALDSGPISNPDGLRNQAEGGALHGMSRALFEEVTWDARESDVGRLADVSHVPGRIQDVPKLETVLINTMDAEASGAGETSITVTAAAIGNAIFDATGVRLRQVPFTPQRVKTALTLADAG